MTSPKPTRLRALRDGVYELTFDVGRAGREGTRCLATVEGTEPRVRFDYDFERAVGRDAYDRLVSAVLSFHLARTSEPLTERVAPRPHPPWYDPTLLLLLEIRVLNSTEYELQFERPDGSIQTIVNRVKKSSAGDYDFLGVETTADRTVSEAILPQRTNTATLRFHACRATPPGFEADGVK